MPGTKLIGVAAALAIASAVTGCGVGEASAPAAAETERVAPVPVEVAMADRRDIFATYAATATLASDLDAPVPARVGGDVVEILVEEGDRVDRNDALARLDGDRLRLEMLAAKANLEQVRSEYARLGDLHSRNLVSAAMYEDLRYDLEALEATYELAKLNYEYSAIRAPIAGVVSVRDVKLGQNVKADQVTFRITDTRELIAHLMIPQSELAKFAAGHSATALFDSMPDARFAATVVRVSPTIDTRTGTFRATAVIDNADGDLAPGMFARFTIAYEKHEDAITVPERAIVLEDDEASVYVVTEDTVSKRIVSTGIHADGRVEVVSGLEGTEQVVVTGQSSLREGTKVLASNAVNDSYIG